MSIQKYCKKTAYNIVQSTHHEQTFSTSLGSGSPKVNGVGELLSETGDVKLTAFRPGGIRQSRDSPESVVAILQMINKLLSPLSFKTCAFYLPFIIIYYYRLSNQLYFASLFTFCN